MIFGFLQQWFVRTLTASLEAAALAAFLYVLSAACRRLLPPSCRCALWSLTFLNLSLSLLPPGLMPPIPQLPAIISAPASMLHSLLSPALPPERGGPAAEGGAFPPAAAAQQEAAIGGAAELSPLLIAAALIWLAGFAAIVLRAAAEHIRLRNKIAGEALPVPESLRAAFENARRGIGLRLQAELRVTNLVRSPALLGVVKPLVLVPAYLAEQLSAKEWDCILRHELMHQRRGDPAAAAAAFLLAALHWFNPAVWYALLRLRREQEAACDAAVLDLPVEKKVYAACILRVLELDAAHQRHRRAPGFAFSAGRKHAERRIRMIQSHDRRRLSVAITGFLIVAMAAVFTWSFTFASPKPSPAAPSFIMPAQGDVKTPFGHRRHPVTGKVSFHDGIDIVNPEPAAVLAAAAGIVTYAGYDGENGFTVRIDHGGGWETEYRHLKQLPELEAGDAVQQGERIAMMGNSGSATGQHLHFTMRKGGELLDPLYCVR